MLYDSKSHSWDILVTLTQNSILLYSPGVNAVNDGSDHNSEDLEWWHSLLIACGVVIAVLVVIVIVLIIVS